MRLDRSVVYAKDPSEHCYKYLGILQANGNNEEAAEVKTGPEKSAEW